MAALRPSPLCVQVVQLLERTPRLGVTPNLINYNIALSALGKNGAWQAAEQLFNAMPERDAVTHETLTAAYGMAGQVRKAEQAFKALLEAGHHPRDYAFTGLIAAHRWEYEPGCWREPTRAFAAAWVPASGSGCALHRVKPALCALLWQSRRVAVSHICCVTCMLTGSVPVVSLPGLVAS